MYQFGLKLWSINKNYIDSAKKLYDERKEKYLSAADFVINGDMGARKTAMQIADIFR